MTDNAIMPHPIQPIAQMPVDDKLADALVQSMTTHASQLHGRRIWLACSGGRDSLALAALCVQLYEQAKLPFLPQLLHVDHGLQMGSQDWSIHVAQWAHAQQLPCQIIRVHVLGQDEQAARHARYNAMRTYLNQDDVLLLAHHADDQAETVLMRLFQGAGVKGLSGIQPWQTQRQDTHRMILWRPWLSVRRARISHYAKRLQLPYIDDPTNDKGDNVRSSIRRHIMPALSAYNPSVVDNIVRSAELLTEAQAIINVQAAQDLQKTTVTSLSFSTAQRVLDIDDILALPICRQRQLLHHWYTQEEPLPPTKQFIDEVMALIQRTDHDHQTEIFWQGRRQSYTTRRYRHQLYKFSEKWLTWLTLTPVEHLHILSIPGVCHDYGHKKHHESSNDVAIIISPKSECFIWQLNIRPSVLAQLFTNDHTNAHSKNDQQTPDKTHDVIIKIAPLDRQQALQTAMATRPQAGKKLYQTLGIPVWLRKSLLVISITVLQNKNGLPTAVPILLLSPFDSWILKNDQSINHPSFNDIIKNAFGTGLQSAT